MCIDLGNISPILQLSLALNAFFAPDSLQSCILIFYRLHTPDHVLNFYYVQSQLQAT